MEGMKRILKVTDNLENATTRQEIPVQTKKTEKEGVTKDDATSHIRAVITHLGNICRELHTAEEGLFEIEDPARRSVARGIVHDGLTATFTARRMLKFAVKNKEAISRVCVKDLLSGVLSLCEFSLNCLERYQKIVADIPGYFIP